MFIGPKCDWRPDLRIKLELKLFDPIYTYTIIS